MAIATPTQEKRKESVTALKDANQHMQVIFKQLDTMDSAIGNTISEINNIIMKIGSIHIETYFDSKFQQRPLKVILDTLKANLEKVRL